MPLKIALLSRLKTMAYLTACREADENMTLLRDRSGHDSGIGGLEWAKPTKSLLGIALGKALMIVTGPSSFLSDIKAVGGLASIRLGYLLGCQGPIAILPASFVRSCLTVRDTGWMGFGKIHTSKPGLSRPEGSRSAIAKIWSPVGIGT